MNRGSVHRLVVLLLLTASGLVVGPSHSSVQNGVSYVLLDGSTIVDDCPICGRPTIIMPLRGTFLLAERETNPLFTMYDVKDVRFQTAGPQPSYTVKGEGMYQIGGEVAIVQQMQLTVQINDLVHAELDSGFVYPTRVWPIIEIDVLQEPINPLQVFSMHLVAAPLREMWFSTTVGFTSGSLKQIISSGDLLSSGGRVVKRNADLVGRLGIMPIVPDLGLDAFDVGAGGEALFSTDAGEFSETLGNLQHGDLLSDRGRIVRRNQQLTSAFGAMPPAPDVGLDAVQVMGDGKIFFSIEKEMFSEKLGVTLYSGDLLSDEGVVVRTNEQLLKNFDPAEGQGDVGLDAVHVWPSGEIWFSTENGFQSKKFGHVGYGDLLSDTGSIVFKNLELLELFQPLEDLADFGLDSLFIVSDDYPIKPSVKLTTFMVDWESGDVWIEWDGNGKVFQLERADEPGGPYIPLGPISPEISYTDPAVVLGKEKAFYRIREW